MDETKYIVSKETIISIITEGRVYKVISEDETRYRIENDSDWYDNVYKHRFAEKKDYIIPPLKQTKVYTMEGVNILLDDYRKYAWKNGLTTHHLNLWKKKKGINN